MKQVKINVLILSCGTRNKVVQAFKQAENIGTVVCTDFSKYAPALYEGDVALLVPKITDSAYLESILTICRKYKIDGLLSLLDPELSIIAANVDRFLEIGCKPMISELAAIENCFDKNEFAETLRDNHISYIRSASSVIQAKEMIEAQYLSFPLMVKPAKGSASIGLNRVTRLEDLERFKDSMDAIIIQEWVDFQEFGIDCYVDILSGKLSQMFIKEKIKMRAGETDKAISCHHQLIRDTILDFFKKYPYQFRGTIDFDIFSDGQECLISEINPRFGGGYPHAYAAGLNYPQLYLNNLQGIENPEFKDFSYQADLVMMKYSELVIKKDNEI